MGKTHLMHAIGRSLLDKYACMRIVYTSSERFMNEMITLHQAADRMPLFHRHYRSADVLLIDDIQILAGKEAHAGRVLPHLQRAVRSPEADRDLERFDAEEHPRAWWNVCARASSGD